MDVREETKGRYGLELARRSRGRTSVGVKYRQLEPNDIMKRMNIRDTMKDGALGGLLFALPSASSPMLFTMIIGRRTQYWSQYSGYYSHFSSGFISGWDDVYAFIRLIPTGSMTISEIRLGQ